MADLTELTDDSFNGFINENSLCVIDFWAPWCGPCMMLGPVIKELSGEYAGKVAFAKLNIDESKVKAGEFNVMSIPTILFVKDGEVVDTVIGALPKEKIKAKIDSLL